MIAAQLVRARQRLRELALSREVSISVLSRLECALEGVFELLRSPLSRDEFTLFLKAILELAHGEQGTTLHTVLAHPRATSAVALPLALAHLLRRHEFAVALKLYVFGWPEPERTPVWPEASRLDRVADEVSELARGVISDVQVERVTSATGAHRSWWAPDHGIEDRRFLENYLRRRHIAGNEIPASVRLELSYRRSIGRYLSSKLRSSDVVVLTEPHSRLTGPYQLSSARLNLSCASEARP